MDFHALRHTFGTNLARAGVSPKLAMDLMRHSDINLTMRLYSHTLISERARALDAIPDFGQRERASQQAAESVTFGSLGRGHPHSPAEPPKASNTRRNIDRFSALAASINHSS